MLGAWSGNHQVEWASTPKYRVICFSRIERDCSNTTRLALGLHESHEGPAPRGTANLRDQKQS